MNNYIEKAIPVTEQKWDENTIPLVSISCITYNHENFIRDAIEGFLMQRTTFPVEILIHDDASTDKTAEIVRGYEQKFPQLIKPIYQTENQYSKGINPGVEFLFPRARGKYIALCEGDDYWTDPLKLQKQVDFLEENPEYSLCVGGFKKVNAYTNETENIIKKISGAVNNDKGYSFTLNDTKKGWITKTLTAVFRNDADIFNKLNEYKYGRDINLFYHILKTGKGFYFTEIMGVYRIHEGGVNSMKQGMVNSTNAYNIYKELFKINRDKFSKHMHVISGINYLGYILIQENKKIIWQDKLKLLSDIIKNIRSLDEIFLFMKRVIVDNIKLFSHKN